MKMRFEHKESFEVFGIEEIFKDGKQNNVPKFWARCHKDGSYDKLLVDTGEDISKTNEPGKCLIGAICGYRETKKNTFPYMICAKKTEKSNAVGYVIIQVPEATWAIFSSEGGVEAGAGIAALMQYAYKYWLPTSGYSLADAPDIETYNIDSNGNYYEEVWIAIKKP